MTEYRPEIDGLRAIAVIPVILFHAGFSWFRGGYVGVDVFFVISGYLIAAIVIREHEAGVFSIARFLERRARRILPALVFVIALCFVPAWLLMLPPQFHAFSQTVAAVSLFGSNLLFWATSGYFDSLAGQNPLLHTWSLGVEEQFYLLFPWVIVLWPVNRRALGWTLAAVALASLALAEWAWRTRDPGAWFFFTPSRAWELLAGCLLAIAARHRPLDTWVGAATRNVASALGVGLVLWAVVTFDASTPTPGLATLVPVAGTWLILAFGSGDTWAGRALSHRWLVSLGLMSYSAYLWHQPLFAFARLASARVTTTPEAIVLSAAALALAYPTWRYVERPWRDRSRYTRRQVFGAAACATVVLAVTGLVGRASPRDDELPADGVFSAAAPEVLDTIVDGNGRPCAGRAPDDACRFAATAGHRNWIVLGDSHAQGLGRALLPLLRSRGDGFVDLTLAGCYYAPGLMVLQEGQRTRCGTAYQDARRRVLLAQAPAVIVVHGRLPLYLSEQQFDNGEGGVEKRGAFILAEDPPSLGAEARRRTIVAAIRRGLQELVDHGHILVMVYPVPEVGWHTPRRVNMLRAGGASVEEVVRRTSVSYAVSHARVQPSYDILDGVAGAGRVVRVRPEELFCNRRESGRCDTVLGTHLAYADIDHLSPYAEGLLANRVIETVDAFAAARTE